MLNVNYLLILLVWSLSFAAGCSPSDARRDKNTAQTEAAAADQTIIDEADQLMAEAERVHAKYNSFYKTLAVPPTDVDEKSPYAMTAFVIGDIWVIRGTLDGVKKHHSAGNLSKEEAREILQRLRTTLTQYSQELEQLQRSVPPASKGQ